MDYKFLKHHILSAILTCSSILLVGCSPFSESSFVEIQKPNLAWNNNSYDYGSLSLGLTSNQTFILTNNGTLPALGCSGVLLSDTTNFSVVSDTCSSSAMLPGSQCSVLISSHPVTLGLKNLTIERYCDDDIVVSSARDQIKVTGVLPQLELSPLDHDFGNIQIGLNSSWQVFTFSNTGTGAAGGCSAPTITDTTNFSIQIDTCGTNNLAAGSICSVSVQANPTTLGFKAATVSRSCTVGGSISTTSNQVMVNGFGAVLSWSVSPMNWEFGSIEIGGNSTEQIITLNNIGNIPATGCSAPVLSDSVNFSLTTDLCAGADIGDYNGCNVGIQAHPTTVGIKAATLTATCAVGGTTTLSIQALGINPSFTALPALNTASSFRYPLHGVETFVNKPMYSMAPFDKNTGSSYTFQISNGVLPPGLSFNPTTGAISGTPTTVTQNSLQICRVDSGVPSPTDCQHIMINIIDEIAISGTRDADTPQVVCLSSGGSGLNDDPILINSIEALDQCIRFYPNKAFLLTADLDFSGNQISGLPNFNGIFDGGNHELKNWNHTDPLFATLLEGAIVRNLKIKNFTTTGPNVLTALMRGSIVHNIDFDTVSINSNNQGMGLITGNINTPIVKPYYHGFIDQITATNISINRSTGGWAWSGVLAAIILDTPYRISNIHFFGTNNYTMNGNVAGAIVGTNQTRNWNDGGFYGDISNVWLDRIRIESGATQSGSGAFLASLFSIPTSGDVITNSYSNSTVNDYGGIGVAGFVGTIESGIANNPLFIVDSYFAGILNNSDGVMTGSSYRSGSVMLVHSASKDSLIQPMNGSPVASSTHSVLSDADFKNPAHSAFAKWISTIWNLQTGVYPTLY